MHLNRDFRTIFLSRHGQSEFANRTAAAVTNSWYAPRERRVFTSEEVFFHGERLRLKLLHSSRPYALAEER